MFDSRPFVGGDGAENVCAFRDWFAEHFALDGKPYTLDLDQARAVLDNHKNTLVVARAGSGKTRVIVAKIAYLLATKQLQLHEIIAFMFNRDAAHEVNQRIAKVEFDGQAIAILDGSNTCPIGKEIHIASTFHKFALDIMKLSGARPELISEEEHDQTIRQALRQALRRYGQRTSTREFEELVKIVSGFVTRAGQKYSGTEGLERLHREIARHLNNTNPEKSRLHRLALSTYEGYLAALRRPKLDFNIMMAEASELLCATARNPTTKSMIHTRTAPLKLILIDEYQDFSQLFLDLIQALRAVCPTAHLFVVGDDWQAINRFAGSDVDYFINFAEYFPENSTSIPLATNYRSHRRIVENANDYMLENYDPAANRAVAFNRRLGKTIHLDPEKTRFDASDIYEDALGDARYQIALTKAIAVTQKQQVPATKISAEAARLLKTVYKILRRNRCSEIMLLHRHNFTSFPDVTLETFHHALGIIASEEGIMTTEDFTKQVRCLTMHKSKGLESEVVIILEANRELILGHHPNADLWQIFGDNASVEKADQHRLLYVAMTRAKKKLYILSTDRRPAI